MIYWKKPATMKSGPVIPSLIPAFPVVLLLLGSPAGIAGTEQSSSGTLAQRQRHPVALVCADGGRTLLVANQKSGSLTVIDTAARRVIAEHDVGRSLVDLAILPDGRSLLVVDRPANQLVLIDYRDRSIRVTDRINVSPDPVRLAVAADGSCSPWPRSGRAGCPSPCWGEAERRPAKTRALAHRQPRAALLPARARHGRRRLEVGRRRCLRGPFGGGRRPSPSDRVGPHAAGAQHPWSGLRTRRPDARHRARGPQPVGTDQLRRRSLGSAGPQPPATRAGRVALVKPGTDTDLLDGSRLFDLGDVGYAAGDPAALAFDDRGNLIVALAGVDEVAITPIPEQAPRRTVVGRQPTAVAPSPDGSFVYVADTLDDTVSIVEIKSGLRAATISLGPQPEPTPADRGERLFSSAKLSHDGWMSCHSCHTDGHTNNLTSDTLGDGSFGAPKRVPSLLGVGTTGPWTWTRSISRLDDQVRKSIETTMRGSKPPDAQVADLTAYLISLAPPSPSMTGAFQDDSPAVVRGREVFQARKCAACHVPPDYTSPERYDVGLADELGVHEFNPPSLRAVSRRDALLHDGRARSLEQVFHKERHPSGLTLTPAEIADLVAFLKTL